MLISVRLDEEDYKMLNEINKKLNEQWEDIFLINDNTTRSQTVRACIRRTHYDLFGNKSNKSDSSLNISLTNT